MEKELVVDSLFVHSKLDLHLSINSLLSAIQLQFEQGFKHADISSYCQNLSLLKDLLTCALKNIQELKSEEVYDDVAEVLDKVCFPLLNHIYPSSDSRKDVLVILGSVSQVIAVCTVFSKKIMSQVMGKIQTSLETFLIEKPSNIDLHHEHCCLDIYTVIEVLRHIVSKFNEAEIDTSLGMTISSLFNKIVEALDLVSAEIIGNICLPLLVKILNLDKDNVVTYMERIWKCTREFSNNTDDRKQYILLCGFANYFFPVNGVYSGKDIRCENKLWEILQAGLLGKDSLNRKRSLYLVKRVVDICETENVDVNTDKSGSMFWWSKARAKELSKAWEDFMLLAEVFEEKQVHVIKPLLPRMKTIIKASAIPQTGESALLHTSWLTTLFLRCSHHESLNIIRWSAETVLSLDLTECPMLQQGQEKYLTGSMLYALHEAKLFAREQGSPVGSLPVLAERLEQFFTSCWSTLSEEKRGKFFCEIVQNICSVHWGPIPLLFIYRGLSLVPSSPCLDKDTILSIRVILTGQLATIETLLRGAMQGFVVQMMVNLTDKSKVPLEDFVQILSLVDHEECLQRGTTLWEQCAAWLAQEMGETQTGWGADNICKFIETSVSKYLETTIDSKYSTADAASAHIVARLLILASDASIATKMDYSQTSTLSRVMGQLTHIITSINSHAYMSVHKADKALLLLNCLLDELMPKASKQDDSVAKEIMSVLNVCASEMLTYICRQMTEAIVTLSDLPLMQLYIDSVKKLLESRTFIQGPNLGKLVDTCTGILTRQAENQLTSFPDKMKQLSAMCMLGTVTDFLSHIELPNQNSGDLVLLNMVQEKMCSFLKIWKMVPHFQKPSTDLSVSQQEWGKITSLYLQNQWQIVYMGLQYSAAAWCDIQELLALSRETLSVGLEETSIPVMYSIKLIISRGIADSSFSDDAVVSVLDACWSSVMEVRRALLFWPVLEAFVHAVFQPCLVSKNSESAVVERLNKFGKAILDMGGEKSGVVNVLSKQLCTVLTGPGMLDHTHKYTAIIVPMCMFGRLLKRGERQHYDVFAALEQLGKQCCINELRKRASNQDLSVRTHIISVLCHLNPADTSHCHLATDLIQLCMQEYRGLVKGITNRFANSLVHRQRHRLIQIVLLLESFVNLEFLEKLWIFVWDTLESECQPSIRHMLEWLAMSAMYRHQQLASQLWILFEHYKETKNIVLCSLLCVVIHMGPHLPPDQQEDYFQRAILNIVPWCMAHHFNTRIFAQATLCKLWDQCNNLQLTNIIKSNAVLQFIVDFNQGNKNSTKNVQKLLDSFFFKFLDFRRDFSLETLFFTLPNMTSLTEEDWIRPELFLQTNPSWSEGRGPCYIQLHNKTDHLKNCDPGVWKYRGGLKDQDEEDTEDATGGTGNGDVQKKIMPWKQMMPDEETAGEIDHGVKQHDADGLVVVTSLISKVPNLGGLCRTSEIFGVSEYVLGKLHHVDDKAFQCLSVTAHKWLPITEVQETRLAEYLVQKRLEGYTLVGVEQTANSVCLTDYTFPVKTLLLLGNEKEGIPVDLISLLDVCVEIPQQGVVRSLNVHVSGALLIWEYRRQQLVKMQTSST